MELNSVYNEDCLEGLKKIENNSIQLTVTSPPYYQLRRYTDSEKEIGIENSVEEYIKNLKNIFQEIYRITKEDGSCYVNISDTYNNKGNLLCVPDKFKLMMIDMGWICRNEIIWHKPNAIPSSAKTRYTNDFEKIYFFVKNKHYKFNTQYEERKSKVPNKKAKSDKSKYNSVEEETKYRQGMNKERHTETIIVRKLLPSQEEMVKFLRENVTKKYLYENTTIKKSTIDHWFRKDKGGFSYPKKNDWLNIRHLFKEFDGFEKIDTGLTEETEESKDVDKNAALGRIKRTTWSVSTKSLKNQHYASYPMELITTPILASSDEGDTVLDPFMGSGTTALCCIENNRQYIGFELNKQYIDIIETRIKEKGTTK